MEKTLGEKRVKADFNPDKVTAVDDIKNSTATCIDMCGSLRKGGEVSEEQESILKQLVCMR
jgi:hypothetical protein